jgi:outer membrane protein assembly factor BamD
MTKPARMIFLALAAGLLLAAAPGCGMVEGWWGAGSDSEAFDTPAQVLANEAELAYKDGNYDEAAELYQQLKDRYPYSRYALLADLRVGDAYFKAERYEEAVLAYDDFIRLHPKNEAVPYAIYQMGMVYHEQMLIPARDPTYSQKAVEQFQRLIRQHPQSEWAVKAKPRLQEALTRLAAHDMFVGRFYLNSERYRAAMGRFKRVLTQYPDVGFYGEALKLIKECQVQIAKLPPEERGRMVERRDLDRALPYPDTAPPDVLDDAVVTPPIGGVGPGI